MNKIIIIKIKKKYTQAHTQDNIKTNLTNVRWHIVDKPHAHYDLVHFESIKVSHSVSEYDGNKVPFVCVALLLWWQGGIAHTNGSSYSYIE